MSDVQQLTGRVRRISDILTSSLRTEPTDPSLAGWGQFVESTSPVFQIGPYGTAAGVGANQIAYPNTDVDPRVKAQLQIFWETRGKLFAQNVRLAFTVLALARVGDRQLVSLRDQIAAEIRGRQLQDGSWGEARPHPTSSAGGQAEVTAWTVLALKRCGGNDEAVRRGAEWLATRIEGAGGANLLSNIGIAAALVGLSRSSKLVRSKALEILQDAFIDREEQISFFDYEDHEGDERIPCRDYLCYPAFYPLAVLVTALGKNAGIFESILLNAFKAELVKKLEAFVGDHLYKNPTARFSSTVDQAIYALAYEQIAAADIGKANIGSAVALYRWSRRSVFVNLVLPIVSILSLSIILASPNESAATINWASGERAELLVRFVAVHKESFQVFAGIAATLLFGTPKRGRLLLWEKLRRRSGGRA